MRQPTEMRLRISFTLNRLSAPVPTLSPSQPAKSSSCASNPLVLLSLVADVKSEPNIASPEKCIMIK